ncbi:MAG TPA: MarR family transcriptional regulator [Gemmatimonadales bacterium]|nr:MarR family transcriptional regulator [Gemmatimonadales bacterium]
MSPTRPPRHKAVLIAILQSADRLRRRGEALFAPHDITLQQFNVLRILRGARPEGLCTLTIAQRMIEQTPGITRLIDRLEQKGLVRRVRSAEDRRQVWCRITPAGERLLERLDDPVDAFDRAAVRGLSPADQDRLTALLGQLQEEPG